MKSINDVMKSLKEIRQQQGFSVQDVVICIKREVGIDISTKTIYGWEEGNAKPDISCFMAMCNLYGIHNASELFYDNFGTENIEESTLGLQRAINLLTAIRDSEYVGESDDSDSLSDNMKTEILYQLMDRAEEEGKVKDISALKWAILQIERQK